MTDSRDNSGKFEPREVVQGKTQIHLSRDVVLDQFKPGKVINDRFEIREMIGEGGMGMVFHATDLRLNRDAALKVPLPELLEDPHIVKRFQQEVALSTELAHPNIVRVHDLQVESHADILFFSMEYLEGKTLRQELLDTDCLKPDKVKEILEQMLNGLSHAHSHNILHRDIKPENIFLCEDGTVKLMDFGIASPIRKTSRWTQLQPSGTFDYMAPELRQQKDPSAASDIYSVGVVLYEMLTGDLPGFASEAPSKIDDGIPPFWDDVVNGCMKNRKRRYQNVGEIREAVKTGINTKPQSYKATKEEHLTSGPSTIHHSPSTDGPQAPQAPRLTAESAGGEEQTGRDSTQSHKATKERQENTQSPQTTAPPEAGQGLTVELPGGVKLQLARIPSGSFMMGSPPSEAGRSDDETQHRVTISKGFYMGKYTVTQSQWKAIMGSNFWKAIMGSNPSHFMGDNLPVERVSWNDCQKFIRKLNQKTGQNFRLPTEAEWEYACRAGTDTAFCYGNSLSSDMANFDGNYPYNASKGTYRRKTTPVGSFKPNAWGLYDMHGNVLEWCSDWYGSYPSGSVTDPTGPSSGGYRVSRGGSWDDNARYCRSAYRSRGNPATQIYDCGFRLVLEE